MHGDILFNSVMHFNATWTYERIAELTQLWAEGMSGSLIAAKMGTTRNAVIGKANRLGLASRATKSSTPRTKLRGLSSAERRSTHGVGREAAKRIRAKAVKLSPVPVAPTPPIERIDDQQIPIAQRCDLMALGNNTCRWPVGEPGTAGFFFCGSPEADLSRCVPYCRQHRSRVYEGRRGAPNLFGVSQVAISKNNAPRTFLRAWRGTHDLPH